MTGDEFVQRLEELRAELQTRHEKERQRETFLVFITSVLGPPIILVGGFLIVKLLEAWIHG